MPSIQDRRDRETVVRPSYQKRRARVSSERNVETTSSRRTFADGEDGPVIGEADLYRAIPSFQPIHLLSPPIFTLIRRARKREKTERIQTRRTRISWNTDLIRTLALLYRISTPLSSPAVLLDKKRGDFNWRRRRFFFFFFFCEDRNLEEEERWKRRRVKREESGRLSRGYDNKDALEIIEEQVVWSNRCN